MADDDNTNITGDMVEAAAKSLYGEVAPHGDPEWDDARVRDQDVFRQYATAALRQGLVGYAVVPAPPEPGDAASRMARARQWIAHEGNAYLPRWDDLTAAEQEQAELEARHWIRAAVNAGVTIVPAGRTVVDLPDRVPDPPNGWRVPTWGYDRWQVQAFDDDQYPVTMTCDGKGYGMAEDLAEAIGVRLIAAAQHHRQRRAERSGDAPNPGNPATT